MLIPIFFTFDENYVVPAIVTFQSLLENADQQHEYALHVLHPNIPATSLHQLQKVVARFGNAQLHLHDTSQYETELTNCPGKSHFSKEIFFKLCAASLFPQYDRILCSDVDVCFMGDIAPSFTAFPDDDFYIAGVDTVLPTDRRRLYRNFSDEELYFLDREICAGYLLFNLAAIRRDNLEAKMRDYYTTHYARLPFPEQDCMAICCRDRIRLLSMSHVVCNNFYTVDADTTAFYPLCACLPTDPYAQRKAFQHALQHPIQLHFIGPQKPWNTLGVPCERQWWNTLKRSGALGFYLQQLPRILHTKMRRYNLSRFAAKLKKRLSLGHTNSFK